MIAGQPKGIPMTPDATQLAQGLQTASPAEVAARRSRGLETALIDVRTPVEFSEVHAEGARLIPLDKLDPQAVMSGRSGSSDQPLFFICKSGGRSAKAVEKCRAAGFTNAISVEGGTAAWERAGLPVVRGARKLMSLERQVRIGAGSLVLVGVLLGWLVHPAFFGLSAFVGAGLVFAGVTDWCGMGMLLAKMPWNTRTAESGGGSEATCTH
jgi:rhodanese-related sulfurtransferase